MVAVQTTLFGKRICMETFFVDNIDTRGSYDLVETLWTLSLPNSDSFKFFYKTQHKWTTCFVHDKEAHAKLLSKVDSRSPVDEGQVTTPFVERHATCTTCICNYSQQ